MGNNGVWNLHLAAQLAELIAMIFVCSLTHSTARTRSFDHEVNSWAVPAPSFQCHDYAKCQG
jgi:hypothetical protein